MGTDIKGTVRITGTITPTNTDDRFATHDALFGKGGWRNVDTLSERNAIPDERRRSGMVVVVDEDEKAYMLLPAPWSYDDSDWEEFGFGGGGGEGNTIHILSGQTITIEQYRQSLVYGDVVVDGGGTLVIDGEMRIINGVLTVEAGGTVELNGSLIYEQVVVPTDLLVYVPVNVGALFDGAYLQYSTTSLLLEPVSLSLNVADGSAYGQMLYWDTGTSMYQPTSSLVWDEAQTCLYVGNSNPSGMRIRSRSGGIHIGYRAGNEYGVDQSVFIGQFAGQGSASSQSIGIGHYALGRDPRYGNNTVALGWYAGYNDYTSSYNVFVGNYAGYNKSSGSYCVFLGYNAGYDNTTGSNNVYIGHYAGATATTFDNICIGSYAGNNLGSAVDGGANVCIGTRAGANGRYNYNVVIGYYAFSNSSGAQGQGLYIGGYAGQNATSIQQVVALGYQAGQYNQSAYNTFLGHRAGRYVTTGDRNTVVGWESGASHGLGYNLGSSNTIVGGWNARMAQATAAFNTVVGYSCAYYLAGTYNSVFGYSAGVNLGTGGNNTLLGAMSGYSISTGSNNVMIGYQAGYSGSSSVANVFVGALSGYSNTLGYSNAFFGGGSGYSNTDGYYNVFIGNNAGFGNTTGFYNTYCGYQAGFQNQAGLSNSFFGANCGYSNISGSNNTAMGQNAMFNCSTGYNNAALGVSALSMVDSGAENTAMGYAALQSCTGSNNVAVGNTSLFQLLTGQQNTAVGAFAGYTAKGSGNVFIGYSAGYSDTSGSNRLYIDNSNTTTPLIYGEFDNNKLWVYGTLYYNAPNSAPADSDLANGQVVAWLDETASPPAIVFKVKTSGGTVMSGAVALS